MYREGESSQRNSNTTNKSSGLFPGNWGCCALKAQHALYSLTS